MPSTPASASARESRSRLRLALLILVLALGASLIGYGIYGLARGPEPTRPATHPAGSASPSPPRNSSSSPTLTAPLLPVTSNPEVFARQATLVLFDWDTTTGLDVADYEHPLIADADPTGVNTPGLLTDLSGYFPTEDEWEQLRGYQTRQWLTITSLKVPSDWGQAVQDSHGQIHDGVIGYTITGTRHRSGTWTGKPASSSQEVAFTIFLACPPETKHCAVLRLSALNNPLQ